MSILRFWGAGGMPGKADMARRPAKPRNRYSIELEETFGTGCQFPDSGEPREEGGTAGNGGSGRQEKRLQMGTQSEVHMDPPGGGPATKVNKRARNGDERIVREWRKSTITKCVRVVKSKLPM